jgi:sarcosine oxidase subunit gamma
MSYDVTTDRLPTFAIFDLKGAQKTVEKWTKFTLPDAPNRFLVNNGVILCHIGPDHWLLRAPLDREERLESQLKPTDAPADISIVRISDTQTFFSITGPNAAEVISIGCTMDLHETVFPQNSVSFSEFFTVKALVMRIPLGFEVAVEQSYANMIADYLSRATA